MKRNKSNLFSSSYKPSPIVPPPPTISFPNQGQTDESRVPPILKELTKTLTAIQETSHSLKNSLKRKLPLEKGEVIGISRGVYEHYGVYVGDNRVIHYTSLESDISSNNSIMETDIRHFLKDSQSFFILNCEYLHNAVKSKPIIYQGFLASPDLFKFFQKQKVYSPEETVQRARSRLGEDKYSLVFNNCEHFAIWCKTGISKSHQVNAVLKLLTPTTVQI